jgi:hypothetical protein
MLYLLPRGKNNARIPHEIPHDSYDCYDPTLDTIHDQKQCE